MTATPDMFYHAMQFKQPLSIMSTGPVTSLVSWPKSFSQSTSPWSTSGVMSRVHQMVRKRTMLDQLIDQRELLPWTLTRADGSDLLAMWTLSVGCGVSAWRMPRILRLQDDPIAGWVPKHIKGAFSEATMAWSGLDVG